MRLAGSGALDVARLSSRESTPTYAALGALCGLTAVLAAWSGDGAQTDPIARAHLALGYAAGGSELLACAAAALAVAFTLPRDLALGRVECVLARPVGPGAFVCGRFLAAVGAAAAALGALAIALGAGIAGLGGVQALASLAPHPARAAAYILLPGSQGEAVTTTARFGLSAGSEAIWSFEADDGVVLDAVRIAPAYVMAGDGGDEDDIFPSAVTVTVDLAALRGSPLAVKAIAHLGRIDVPARRSVDVPIPATLASGGGGHTNSHTTLRVLLTVESPGALVGFDAAKRPGVLLLEERASLLEAALAALAGGILQACVFAALATLGACFLSAWPAALFAAGIGLAARFPELLRGFQASVMLDLAHHHGHEAPLAEAAEAAPSPLVAAVQHAADALAACLPDLGRADLVTSLCGGRVVGWAEIGAGALSALPFAAALLIVAGLLMRLQEPGARRS